MEEKKRKKKWNRRREEKRKQSKEISSLAKRCANFMRQMGIIAEKEMNGKKMTPFYQPYFYVGCFAVRTCRTAAGETERQRTRAKEREREIVWIVNLQEVYLHSVLMKCSIQFYFVFKFLPHHTLRVRWMWTCAIHVLRRPNSFAFFFAFHFIFSLFYSWSRLWIEEAKVRSARRKKWKIKSKWNRTVTKGKQMEKGNL